MRRLAVLLAVSLVSSVADTRVSCPYASTCQRLNAMDDWRPAPTVHRSPPSFAIAQATPRETLKIFTDLGLTVQQIATIDAGRPVAKVLSWGGPSEVYVFGAVRIDGSSETYLAAARQVEDRSGTRGYLGIGEIHANATVADLGALALEADDVKALKNCREGSCDMQLPTSAIQAFHDGVIWSRPDAVDQANALVRLRVLELVQAYQRGGNEALGEYRDKEKPARVAAQFQTMIDRASVLPNVLPELRRYLLEYPNAELAGADSFFYWEKVSFGLKPTIRVNHAVIYRGRTRGRDYGAVAIKQLYATHYFHTAGLCGRRNGGRPPQFLSAHAQGFAAGGTDRRQGLDAPEDRRRQDALVARKSARVHQADR